MISQIAKIQLRPAPKNPTARQRYILGAYTLELIDGTYTARCWFDGHVTSEIANGRIENVIAQARRRWGHHNHRDEAEAFDTIFPPVHTL